MFGAALFCLLFAIFVPWFWARSRARRSGLPAGAVVYQDTDRCVAERPLYSQLYSLCSRPDYLISHNGGLVPVELKKCPVNGPYHSHAAQLFGYCLLVEETLARPVPYAVLRYSDREVSLDFTPERRQWVTGILADIYAARSNGSLTRNHNSLARCRNCSVCGSRRVALSLNYTCGPPPRQKRARDKLGRPVADPARRPAEARSLAHTARSTGRDSSCR
jgi:hypothetical protein